MPGYRFCRPDDIPLLVQAVNECYDVHFPEEAPTTLDSFMFDVRVMDLWSSSCMIGYEGDQLISVIIGCKRQDETMIYKIGTHPDFKRQGHAEHMLRSMSAKLAVLGPPRIVSEVPTEMGAAKTLLEKVGFTKDDNTLCCDFELTEQIESIGSPEMFCELPISDFLGSELFADTRKASWQRCQKTLENGTDKLNVLGVLSVDGIEAAAVYRVNEQQQSVVYQLSVKDGQRRDAYCEMLLRRLSSTFAQPVLLPAIFDNELSVDCLANIGFKQKREYEHYFATPLPG